MCAHHSNHLPSPCIWPPAPFTAFHTVGAAPALSPAWPVQPCPVADPGLRVSTAAESRLLKQKASLRLRLNNPGFVVKAFAPEFSSWVLSDLLRTRGAKLEDSFQVLGRGAAGRGAPLPSLCRDLLRPAALRRGEGARQPESGAHGARARSLPWDARDRPRFLPAAFLSSSLRARSRWAR